MIKKIAVKNRIVIGDHMDYKKSCYMLATGIWSGMVMIFLGGYLEMGCGVATIGNATAFMGLMLMAGGIVQTLIFYKCPNCGKRFNIRVNWSSGWLVFMRIVQRYFSTKIQTILQSRLIRNTRRDAAAVCY